MKKVKILLCAVLVFTLILAANIVGVSGKATVFWYDSGADTLVINSSEDLAAFVLAVNDGNNFSGKTVRLNCDIIWSAGSASEWSEITAPKNTWTPIGTSSAPFTGTFDGNGHTVSGLYYHGSAEGVGFFGYAKNAVIKGLHITNSYFSGFKRIGSVVGSCNGGTLTILGCSSNAYLLSNCTKAEDHNVGGIAGFIDGGSTRTVTIEDCAYTGNITSDEGVNIGGIAGGVKGSSVIVSRCLATGKYTSRNRVGGIVGRSYLDITISDCYADVNLITWGTSNQGGIIGGLRYAGETPSTLPVLNVYNCYYNGSNLRAKNDTMGKFQNSPTRLGSSEYDTTKEYGSVAPNSTYYTDSTNDNSYTDQGNQKGLPSSVRKLGGLDDFLSVIDCFDTNMYGEVVLTTLKSAEHDCERHVGKWEADPATGGQKGQCLAPGCRAVITREASFKIMGVSVRHDGIAGIRFLTQVDKNEFFKDRYNGNDNNYVYENANVTFGTIIIPENLLAGEPIVGTEGALNVVAEKTYNTGEYHQDENVFYYSAVLVNFPEKTYTYNRTLMVRSYMTYTDESGEQVYIYTNTEKTSFYDIASRIYENTAPDIKNGLNKVLALGAVDDGFFADVPNRVLLLEEASKELFDSYAASLASQGFIKHTNYEYAGNSFGLYYNDDFVVTFYYTPKSIGKYTELNQDWYVGGSKPTQDMDEIAESVYVDDIFNVMRVIVEKRSIVDLPATKDENIYEDNVTENTIAYAFPNNNYEKYGMGYIIQLSDGSFVIIDGGFNFPKDDRDESSREDADYIMEYLTSKHPADNNGKIVISAWILTHSHDDHTKAMERFVEKYNNDVVLEQVIYNFMSGDIAVPVVNRDQERYAQNKIKRYFPDVKIIRAHTGYKFYVRNAEISILYSIDDIMPDSFETMFQNNESIAFDVIIDGTQRLMFTGEIFIPGSRALVNMYGENLKSDVVQISHHGNFGATLEVNSLIWPESQDYTTGFRFALLPNGNNAQARERLALPENAPFVDALGEDITGRLNKIYVSGDLIFDSGIINGNFNVEHGPGTVKKSGAIGRWKTIPLHNDQDILIPWPDEWNNDHDILALWSDEWN